jgi:hypothetical protein
MVSFTALSDVMDSRSLIQPALVLSTRRILV